MMRNIWFITVMVAVLIGCVGCNGDSEGNNPESENGEEQVKSRRFFDEEAKELGVPELAIKAGDEYIDYTVGLNTWNDTMYDRMDNFLMLVGESEYGFDYVVLDELISITFSDGVSPDKVVLRDYVLNEQGSSKYGVAATNIPITFDQGAGEFNLDMNMAALLSSNSKDYEPGATIRGFKMVCQWGENECEYAFIIRSDAYGEGMLDETLGDRLDEPEEERTEETVENLLPVVRNYDDIVEEYTPLERNKYFDSGYTYTLDLIQDLSVLSFDMPWDKEYKAIEISFNQLKNKVDDGEKYSYAIEKSSNEVYMIGAYSDKTIVDTYRIEYVTPYDLMDYELKLSDSKKYEYILEDVKVGISTICLIYKNQDDEPTMEIMDRDFVTIETIMLGDDVQIDSFDMSLRDGGLYYILGMDQSDGVNKVMIHADYSGYGGRHFITDEFRNPIENGKLYASMFWYSMYDVYRIDSFDGDLIFASNGNSVMNIRKKNSSRHWYQVVINGYALLWDENKLERVYYFDQVLEKDHPIYSLNINNNSLKGDINGYFYYVDKDTDRLIKLDKDFNKIMDVEIVDANVLACVKRNDYWNNWTVEDGYLITASDEGILYLMELETGEIEEISIENEYVSFSNYQVLISDYIAKRFNLERREFLTYYRHTKDPYFNGAYFEYQGVAYYEDDPDILYRATDKIEARDDILPESEAPDFYYGDEKVYALSSKKYNNEDYYLLTNGWVGTIDNEVFKPLVMEMVRDFYVTEYGVVYIGYEEVGNVIRLVGEGLNVSFQEEYAIDAISVENEWVYYVIDNVMLKKVSLDDLSNKESSVENDSIVVANLEEIAGRSPREAYQDPYNFKLVSNGDYMVAYDEHNYKIIVFDEDEVEEVLDTSFLYLTEDNQIMMDVLAFVARHDISSKTDVILGEYYFIHTDMVFDDMILSCTPYEGPSSIQAIEIYDSEINVHEQYSGYSEDVDYSIELWNSHQAYIIVYDHELKKLYLHDVVWGRPEYELTEDGLKYWLEWNDFKQEGFIPLRENSKVQLYGTKRT